MQNEGLEIGGVRFSRKNEAWIADDTVVGSNVVIFPGAILGRPPLSVKAQARKSDFSALPPLKIGDNCVIGANAVIYRGSSLGNDCLVGDSACIRENVHIGNECLIAMGVTMNCSTTVGSRVKIMDNSHITGNVVIEDGVFISTLVSTTNDNSIGREQALNVPIEMRNRQGPHIRRNATIGQGACILPGIEIGENAIVGANSVVTKSVPERVLVIGVPARFVRSLRDDEIKA